MRVRVSVRVATTAVVEVASHFSLFSYSFPYSYSKRWRRLAAADQVSISDSPRAVLANPGCSQPAARDGKTAADLGGA